MAGTACAAAFSATLGWGAFSPTLDGSAAIINQWEAAVGHGSASIYLLLAGITTAAGFLSLALSPIRAIQQFGLLTTLGLMLCVVATLTVAPAVLAALVAPAVLLSDGALDVAPATNPRALAALVAIVVAWKAKNVAAVFVAGMSVVWLLQAFT